VGHLTHRHKKFAPGVGMSPLWQLAGVSFVSRFVGERFRFEADDDVIEFEWAGSRDNVTRFPPKL
jgi:hypothetical protein